MIDIGDTVPLEFTVTDELGELVEAGTVTLTIRLPDNTSVTPTPEHPEVGRYELGYVVTAAGRHHVRWVATEPEQAFTDAFEVALDFVGIVSLDQAKHFLKIPLDDNRFDDVLRSLVGGVTRVIESMAGAIVREMVTQKHSGGHHGREAIALDRGPVIEIVEITENGSIVDPDGYSLDNYGVVTRVAGYQASRWLTGVNNIVSTYVVGRTVTGPNLIEAATELIRINYRPVQGGNYSPFDRAQPAADDERWRLGFFVPNGVIALLSGEIQPPGIA